jgi:hypothetical protein
MEEGKHQAFENKALGRKLSLQERKPNVMVDQLEPLLIPDVQGSVHGLEILFPSGFSRPVQVND